jgi:hypothetical protein
VGLERTYYEMEMKRQNKAMLNQKLFFFTPTKKIIIKQSLLLRKLATRFDFVVKSSLG